MEASFLILTRDDILLVTEISNKKITLQINIEQPLSNFHDISLPIKLIVIVASNVMLNILFSNFTKAKIKPN